MTLRFRTAAILSVVLIGVLFGLPALVQSIFLPSLERGAPDPLPMYDGILLTVASFCARVHWFLVLPIVVVTFAIAAITSVVRRYRGA